MVPFLAGEMVLLPPPEVLLCGVQPGTTLPKTQAGVPADLERGGAEVQQH